ncbi:MAG: hypothetical protein ACYCQM_01450 [Acidithiobacillus sp.]
MSASHFCPSCRYAVYLYEFSPIIYCDHDFSHHSHSPVGTFDTCSLFKPANDEDVPRDEIDEGFVSGGVL